MHTTTDFTFKGSTHELGSGSFRWSAPSNIALVKYWGKKENQIPANPSLSFTLNQCKTITQLDFDPKATKGAISFEFKFEGEPKPSFHPKIQQFFERILPYCNYITNFHFTIDTQNTFPHSSGIASSASGMAALAVNIMSLERILQPEMEDNYFWEKASFLARLGSGSACRSLKGSIVVWGEHEQIKGSTPAYGVAFEDPVHPIFQNYQDTILLVDKGEKQVSSTVGHDLMHGHPFAAERFAQAPQNLSLLVEALKTGDMEAFIRITESEALTLHAMMMTSTPYFILMKPNTLEIINRIWRFRQATSIPVCFTLDAGANVHVLYPENDKATVLQFIKNELVGYCQKEQYICDAIGNGAQNLTP